MKALHESRTDRIVSAAAWLYVAPRAAIGILFLAALGLAAFLVIIQLTLIVLHRLGG